MTVLYMPADITDICWFFYGITEEHDDKLAKERRLNTGRL